MLVITQVCAFLGVGLAAAAYLPQIVHLVRERCSAGISRSAFAIWLVASFLITSHALATGAGVFVALGSVQIVATAIILVYATRYGSSRCASHGTPSDGADLQGVAPGPLEARPTSWVDGPSPLPR